MKHMIWSFAALIIFVVVTGIDLILLKSSDYTRIKRNLKELMTGEEAKCHDKRLLVISFDGFRWNYLNRTQTPNFDRFIHKGVHARHGLKNAFVTKTLPNHYTLATGLWEESHNVVGTNMYDPVLNLTFTIRNSSAAKDPAWFDAGGEPIWVTNQLHDNGHHSGILMWVGNAAPVHDTLPTKYIAFEWGLKNETKIETIIEWFKGDCQMNLGMTYFTQPDVYGHQFGPESDQVTRMIGGMDELVGYMLTRFQEEDLLANTNIILTSDHGFGAISKKGWINLDNFIKPGARHISDITPVAAIWPHEGYFNEIYDNLTAAANESGHFIVYKKEDIPEHLHYKHSRRTAPIIVIANEYYGFTALEYGDRKELGDHGYDNGLMDMHPFFLAMGPDFKSGFSVDTFENVDVYPLMCHLLQVEPSPNNGSMDVVSLLLKSPRLVSVDKQWMHSDYLVSMSMVAGLILLFLAISAIYTNYNHVVKKKGNAKDGDAATTANDEEAIQRC